MITLTTGKGYKTKVDLMKCKVKTITYPHGEYRLGSPVEIIDEGSFYRIDGTHLFDKHKIKDIVQQENRVKIEMIDKVVVLEICDRHSQEI